MEEFYCYLCFASKFITNKSFGQILRVVLYRVTDDEPVLVLEILRDQKRNQSAGRAGDDDIVFTEVVYLSVDASLQIQVLVHAFLRKRARQSIVTLKINSKAF